jgi:2-desacetyl-2-hydroxyethyl bacteriochlorophyllide A dehydrogenase
LKRQALVFSAPRRVEIAEEECGPPAAGQLLVRTRVSAISAGTELLAFRGQLPAELARDEVLPGLAAGSFAYPFHYGYAAVGDVVAVGAGVAPGWIGRRVFGFQPHASAFLAAPEDVCELPAGMEAERAALLANMETAVNLVLDGAPRLGERAVIFGQGTVGLLTTALLARFPLQALVVVDPIAARARLGGALGASHVVTDPAETPAAMGDAGADLAFELTGNPAGLKAALEATGREGRVIVGSFYGGKRHEIDLGAHFHRGRITIASSQVSRLSPALTGRWDRARRRDVAWQALGRTDTAPFVTHRFPLAHAAEAYARLDAGPAEALQILLTYESGGPSTT